MSFNHWDNDDDDVAADDGAISDGVTNKWHVITIVITKSIKPPQSNDSQCEWMK